MSERPVAPAVARNREPILALLRDEFEHVGNVLEIGSGTGEHAVFFAQAMPWLTWQTSDRSDNHPGIIAWIEYSALTNVVLPLDLDVAVGPDPDGPFDAVFSANTAHIMSIDEVAAMFALVGRVLADCGSFFLYGPFRRDGVFKGEGNAHFDRSLRRTDPTMGIRDLEQLDRFAAAAGMRRIDVHDMPANNHVAVWRRSDTPAGTP